MFCFFVLTDLKWVLACKKLSFLLKDLTEVYRVSCLEELTELDGKSQLENFIKKHNLTKQQERDFKDILNSPKTILEGW